MRYFLKSLGVWHIVESEWIASDTTIAEWTTLRRQTHVVNDKAMNAICLALSPSEFSRISHCETALEACNVRDIT
jgi:hypothetical protein